MSVWVVVPAYNEGQVVADTVVTLTGVFDNIVVVDDCSSDNTGNLALKAGAFVCRHPINLGQGAALQTGINFALSKGADIIVMFDADGQHSPSDAVKMVEILGETGVDVVLASRFLGRTEGMSKARGYLLKAATAYTRISTGLKLTDTHNGLRVLSRKSAQSINLKQNRMAHASEILEQISSLGLSYVEFPVTIFYSDYSKSKGQKMTGAFAIMADLIIRRLYK